MKTPHSPESSQKNSKLVTRSEVISVIQHLVSLENPSRNERIHLVKRLHALPDQMAMQEVLVKELHRAKSDETRHVVTELLMELGTIDFLQDRLWQIIRDPASTDESKDSANLILRHLGDNADPDLYLQYLDDPQALIGKETIRMLEVSSENPEALIDFIDFILSLPTEDQEKLLQSLQADYACEHLVNLYLPLLESDPAPSLWALLVDYLAESKSAEAAETLARILTWPSDRVPVPAKQIEKALITLQLAGVYQPGQSAPSPDKKQPHRLTHQAEPFDCFVTLSDGIGNQGLVFSRQRLNGDIAMMSVALNDQHGIIDCFGFYQLSAGDFHKIMEKFHEGATKVKVPPSFVAFKLQQTEALNHTLGFRIPYEYRCWKPLLDDISPELPQEMTEWAEWIKPDWFSETDNLYQHPDFASWFMEQGDMAMVTRALQQVALRTEELLQQPVKNLDAYILSLEGIADHLILSLLQTDWKTLLVQRLIEAAYLLHCQNTHTFRNLAATEAHKLQTLPNGPELLTGFARAYGRRCVEEELLRLRTGSTEYETLSPIVDAVLEHWQI